MKTNSAKKFALFLLFISLIGCAGGSFSGLFTHYSAALKAARDLTVQGQYQEALKAVPAAPFGVLLDSLERGRLALLAGDLSTSNEAWNMADRLVREEESKAAIQLSEGLNQASALVSNDNMLSYFPSDYELGFLHLYRALYFLQNQDLNAALVEVRRANQVQEKAKKSRQAELQKVEESINKNQLNEQTNVGAVLARYPNVGDTLAQVQNGYLFFLSALLYEAEKNANGAFIDYSRALAVAPENKYVANALMRVAKQQGRTQELKRLEQKYGAFIAPKKGQGQLVILMEEGVVKAKSGWQIPFFYGIPTYQSANLNFTLPYYDRAFQSSSDRARIQVANQRLYPALLTDVNAMADKALSEAIPGIVTRQVLRLIAKNELIKLSQKDETGLAQILAGVYSIASEQPDTRSWQTLPEKVALLNQYYSKGQVSLTIMEKVIPINIKENRTTLLWLSRQGGSVTYWQGILGEL